MRILVCHNYYQQHGGEDVSFADEARLLGEYGHEVTRYTIHNDSIDEMSRWAVARRSLWSRQSYNEIRALIRERRPDVVHLTNTFPLISPSACYAARREGVPVVQALRNYRLLCPGALLHRDGKVCEDCLGKRIPWPAIKNRCYRGSRSASTVVTAMVSLHRLLRTWHRTVNLFYTLTEFSRQKFIAGGFPASKLVVKPNFVLPDPGPGGGDGGFAVFVGRLSAEKGITTLLEAWQKHELPVPLKIVGDGPLGETVSAASRENSKIEWLGQKPLEEVMQLVGQATTLVMPSVWYETFGRTTIEAFAAGTPVIGSRMGATGELIDTGRTGFLFNPGDPEDLAAKVQQLHANEEQLQQMRNAARSEYLRRYTPAANYEMLMNIYAQARGGVRPENKPETWREPAEVPADESPLVEV